MGNKKSRRWCIGRSLSRVAACR